MILLLKKYTFDESLSVLRSNFNHFLSRVGSNQPHLYLVKVKTVKLVGSESALEEG